MNSSQGNVLRYFNNGKKSDVQAHSSIGLSNVAVTNNDGILNCQFNRTKDISSIPTYYSLFNNYYVLLAKGHLSAKSKKKVYFKAKKSFFSH